MRTTVKYLSNTKRNEATKKSKVNYLKKNATVIVATASDIMKITSWSLKEIAGNKLSRRPRRLQDTTQRASFRNTSKIKHK